MCEKSRGRLRISIPHRPEKTDRNPSNLANHDERLDGHRSQNLTENTGLAAGVCHRWPSMVASVAEWKGIPSQRGVAVKRW